jgi:hypothetical protein
VNSIPITPLTLEVARRIVWFEPPEQALSQPVRFLAYAMSYARHEDMRIIRRYVSDDDFRYALDHAPPGIVDPRSWAYWNIKMGRYPPPRLPERNLGAAGQGIRQRPSSQDPHELRRRAQQDWLAQYGPGAQTKKPRS